MSTVTSVLTNPLTPLFFNNLASTAFNVTNQTINLGTNHNFTTGDYIYFYNNSANHQTGLTTGDRYFVIVIDATTIKLATSYGNAISNTPVVFTTPNSTVTYTFTKIYTSQNNSRLNIRLLPLYPCYTRSSIVFNSSIPVEISISYPAYQSVYNNYSELTSSDRLVHLCGLRDPINNNSWYAGIGPSFFSMLQVCSETTTTDSGIYLSGSSTSGWNQKYVITPSRQIEFWAGVQGSSLSLIRTSTAIAVNTSLNLEFGANFNNLSINNCTVKYL